MEKTMAPSANRTLNRHSSVLENIPNSAVFNTTKDKQTKQLKFVYLSETWEEITGVSVEESIADSYNAFKNCDPEDALQLLLCINELFDEMTDVLEMEVKYNHPVKNKECRFLITAFPYREGENIVSGGFILDITERNKIEKELIAERKRLSTLYKPNAYLYRVMLDSKTKHTSVVYLSSSFEAVTGMKPDELMKNPLALVDIMHPDDKPHYIQARVESIKNRTNFFIELRILVNGKYRWLQKSLYPHFDGDNWYWEGITTDISDRKKAEQKLARETESLKIIGEHIPNGFLYRYDYDAKTDEYKYTYFSSSATALTGISVEEAMNNPMCIAAIMHPDDRDDFHEKMDKCRKNKEDFFYDVRVLVDGKWRWLKYSAYVHEGINNVWHWEGIVVDITELKEAEQKQRLNLELMVKQHTVELKEANEELLRKNIQLDLEMKNRAEAMRRLENSEIKMRNFIEQSYEGILIVDDHGQIIEWNREQERISGIKRKDAVGEYCWELFKQKFTTENTESVEKYHNIVLSLIDPNNPEKQLDETEFTIQTRGKERYIVVSSFHIAMTGKFYVGQIVRDVTRQKLSDLELSQYRTRLEQMVEEKTIELIRAKAKAEESDRLKSAFLANMSHEIRTPLNGITGMLELLDTDISPEERREYISLINSCSTNLIKLVSDIIDMSKIEAQQMTINPIPVQLNELMRELHTKFEANLKTENKSHLQLVLDQSNFIENCVIYADPDRLRQTLHNLIENAVKFTDKGYIRFGYRQSGPEQLEFTVEDTGVGLTPAQQYVIFRRFRQAEFSNTRQQEGAGLGLPIARNLAQLHGGKMWVESLKDSGSTFYFTISYLPVKAEDIFHFDEAKVPVTDKKPLAGKTVLLFTDESTTKMKYYKKLITATGAFVLTAETRQKWLETVQKPIFIDMIIGEAALFADEEHNNISRIKKARPHLPIALFANIDKEIYKQLLEQELCNTVVVKDSFGYDDILKMIEQHTTNANRLGVAS